MAENSIKVGIQAELQNYDKIVQYITDGIEKGLVDGVSDKALQKIANRLKTATEQLNLGNFNAALDTLEKIGSGLLHISESINVAAGAASSELGDLVNKLNEAKRIKDDLERNTPKGRYRELNDSQGNPTGQYVRAKAGLLRSAVGIATEEQWKTGQASFTGANGQQTTIDYGGKTWSINSAVNALVKALNDGALVLNQEIKEAAKEFGYDLTKNKEGVFSANRQDLTAERASIMQAWQENVDNAKAQVQDLQLQVDEATVDVESVKIQAETGEFVTPIKDIVSGQKRSADLQEKYNKTIQEEAKAQTIRSNAAEAARDAEDKLKQETKAATTATQQQSNAIGKAVTTFFGYQMALRQLRKLWREAIHTITELDKQLTNQAIVTNLTREETWQLVTTYQQLADQAGVTQTEIAGVTTEYLRQGETLDNALKLTKAATAAATVAGISASDSVKYLTTAIHGFKLEAEDALAVSDKFAALAAQAATNYEDLAIALSKVASQAELAGMSMNYTLALLTTGLDITQEAPESIGTALKTVIARMREISDYGKTLDDEMSLNQVEAGLKAVGIQLRSGTGELRSTEAVLDELGRKWNELSANQQAAVAKALAGTRQQSRLVAIMENYDDVIKNMNVANNSLGATTAQQVKYLQGMEAAMNRLQNAYQSLIESLVKSDFVIGIVNTITNLLQQVQKFLNNPFGRTALVSGIISLLFKSKEFVDRIRTVLDQILMTLNNVRKEEERITAAKQKQLDKYKQQVAQAAGISEQQLNKAGFGKTERSNGWLSNRSGESSLTDAIGSLFKFGPGYNQRVSASWQSWNQNNSPWAKVSEAWNNRQVNKQIIGQETSKAETALSRTNAEIIAQEERLAEARQKTAETAKDAKAAEEDMMQAMLEGDMSPEGMRTTEAAAQAQAKATQAKVEQEAIEKNIEQLRNQGLESEKTISVLKSKQLTNEQKKTYLANKQKLAKTEELKKQVKEGKIEQDKLTEEEKQLLKEEEQTREDIKQAEQSTSGKQTGGKFSKGVSAVSGAISAVSGTISLIKGVVETVQNRYKEAVDQALDKSKEIQSKIYENTQTMTNLENLSSDLQKLDKQVVKTADSMKQLADVRSQLLTELELTEAEGRLYTNQQLYDKAMAKRAQLETKNQELLVELGDTLLGAANNYDAAAGALNILGRMGEGAMIGAGVGAVLNTIPALGQAAYAAAVAIGTAVGAIAGAIEEISKKMAAEDAKGKVHELLQSEEGVGQMRYYFQAMYKNVVDTTTAAGKELANSVKTTYASLIESLSGEDMEKLLDKYNWDVDALAKGVSQTLADNGDALRKLTNDSANYQERVQAATEIYAALSAESEELGNAFLEQYGSYVQLGAILGDHVAVMDKYKLSMTAMNDLLTQLAEDGWTIEEMYDIVGQLGDAMADGTLSSEELAAAIGNMSDEAIKATEELISGGQDIQSLADQFTYGKNQVTNIRDTQAKWGSMSASERQSFIGENEDFFNIEIDGRSAYDAFKNGEDLTEFIEVYKKEVQDGLLETTKNLIMSTEMEIARLEREWAEETDEERKAALEKQITTAKRELKDLQETYSDVNSMFDLTLSEVVSQQNAQISKLKEMYQAEEDALVKSLNKRKEAYQKYFDGLSKAESLAEYNENREDLVTAIAKVGAGTDATSRKKVADLQRQLQELDQQEAQRQKEEARQAVLENIDDEIGRIEEQFEKLLSSDQALLDSMDENTYFQYLAYLAQSGQTEEAKQLAIEQMSDLLKGKWSTKGLEQFGEVASAATTTTPTVSETEVNTSTNTFTITNTAGGEEHIQLTEQQMKELVTQLMNTVNKWTGLAPSWSRR